MTARKMVGRPPRYKTKEEIEGKIFEYFRECEGELLMDNEGNPVLNKFGCPIYINRKPPTITGLALALGFTTRTSLLNYQGKKEFMDTITRAKTMVEEYTERRLFDRDGSNGAQFSLRNNFGGWNEKTLSELDTEEQKARIEKIKAETAMIKKKSESDIDIEAADDGFLEALNGTAAEDWSNEDD